MQRGKIKPKMVMDSVGFRATSGNVVTRAAMLGENGMYAAWRDKPTPKDAAEFVKWIEAEYPDYHVDRGGIDRNKQEAKREYEKWLEMPRRPGPD